jgi:hypothetical protein
MKAATKTRLEQKQIRDLLTAVFTLCSLDSSLDKETMDQLIRFARAAAKKRIKLLRPNRRVMVDLDVLGHVIYIWQRTPSYLDDDGQPAAIPARGTAPSIQALFRDVRRANYFEQGLKHLIRFRRVRQVSKSRYLPCSEVTIVNGLTPEMVNLLNLTINRLVSTVLFNTSQSSSRNLRLVERVTSVPDLPVNQIRAFKEFAREQGGSLINTMNDWLESRRGARKPRAIDRRRHVTAGLHVFSFVERNHR